MKKISEADNFNRMTHFFQLLNIIENDKDFEFIVIRICKIHKSTKGRLEKVYEYSINNFNDSSICLETI
jgi:hypothetical protein